MPYRPQRPCRENGCNRLAIRGEAYCEVHRKRHMYEINKKYDTEKRDPEAAAFYNSPAWRKLSTAYRNEHPLCELCLAQGKYTPAKLVDHKRPIKQGGAKLDPDNLQSLCQSCHEKKSNAEGSRGHAPGGRSNLYEIID